MGINHQNERKNWGLYMTKNIANTLVVGLVGLLAVTPAQAVVLTLEVSPQPAQIGDIVYATLSIDSEGASFDAFSLNIDYDPSIVRYRDDLIDFSVFTGVGGYTVAATTPEPMPPTGRIDAVSGGNFLNDFSGTFDLLRFAFEAVGVGASTITLNDGPSGFIFLNGQNVQNGPVTAEIGVGAGVSVVPLPTTAWLLLSSVAGLALVRLRRART